ncbi:MAG: hypothetical protein J6A12_06680, partial [Oscillospiraceae bacterium]|nr:hypothetical protein [Oscillospiraceae bacterium]
MDFKNLLKGKKRRAVLAAFDMFCFILIDAVYYLMSVFLEHGMPVASLGVFIKNSLILFFGMFLFRFLFNIYRMVWRYTSTKSYFALVAADFCGSIAAFAVSYALHTYGGIWHIAMVAPLTALLTLLSRFSYRLLYKKMNGATANATKRNTALIGAGQLGSNLANDLLGNPKAKFNPCFFVDADKLKIGRKVAGLEVYSPEDASSTLSNKLRILKLEPEVRR